MIDAIQIATKAGYVDIQTEGEGLVQKTGNITITQTTKKYEKISNDNVPDIEELTLLTYHLDEKTGTFHLKNQKYTGFSGSFAQENERWHLQQSPTKLEIAYQINITQKEPQIYEAEVVHYNREKGEITAKLTHNQEKITLLFDENKTKFYYLQKGEKKEMKRIE
jgi:hypothetical protein